MSNSTIEFMDLPDEILVQVLGSVDPKTLTIAKRVNQRLHSIAQDPGLIKLHPHHIIEGHPYLYEDVYYGSNKKLLPEVCKANIVDLSWLVKNTTTIIKESGLTSLGWYLLQDASQAAAWDAAVSYMQDETGEPWGEQDGAVDAWDEARSTVWSFIRPLWCVDYNAAWNLTVRTTKEYVTPRDVLEYLLESNLTDPIEIGEHAYQIAECLMLRAIDKDLCLRIHSIVKKYDPVDITVLVAADLFPNNPWIQQYHELYGATELPVFDPMMHDDL